MTRMEARPPGASLMTRQVVLILEERQAVGPGRESVLVSGQKGVHG